MSLGFLIFFTLKGYLFGLQIFLFLSQNIFKILHKLLEFRDSLPACFLTKSATSDLRPSKKKVYKAVVRPYPVFISICSQILSFTPYISLITSLFCFLNHFFLISGSHKDMNQWIDIRGLHSPKFFSGLLSFLRRECVWVCGCMGVDVGAWVWMSVCVCSSVTSNSL